MKVNSGQAPSTLIPEYIGSDFDKVVTVSDNIDYVKDVAEGIEGLPVTSYIGDEPPTQPLNGAEWYCTTDGRSYVWYMDADSGQWVESSPQSTMETDPSTVFINTVNIFALWKRSATEAGLNLVAGSFEEGGVLTSSTDVLLHKESKSIYAWTGVFPLIVAPGTDPAPLGSGGWVDRSDVTLRGALKSTSTNSDTSFVFEGDSITAGNTIGGYKYSDVFSSLRFADKKVSPVVNVAVGGSWIGAGENSGNNITDRYASLVRPHRPASHGGDGAKNAYLILLIGTNDISVQYGAKSAATITSQLNAYIDNAISDGFIVVLQTILPRQFGSAFWTYENELTRLIINRDIKSKAIHSSIVADTASVLTNPYGPLFNDSVHPTPGGSDMIARYLDGGLTAGDFITGSSAVTLNSPSWTGRMRAENGSLLTVGNAYMRTWIGSENYSDNGFLQFENLNPSGAINASRWQWQCGVTGDQLSLQTVADDNSFAKDFMVFKRSGINTWLEIGNAYQKLRLGTPNSAEAGYLQMDCLLSVNSDTKRWEASTSAEPDGNCSYSLRCVNDANTTSNPAITHYRSGATHTGTKIWGWLATQAPTGSVNTGWKLGAVKASAGGNAINPTKYVTVEINGQLVNLAVINDPTVSS